MKKILSLVLGVLLALPFAAAFASVSAARADQLGKSLTLVGAERAGNKAGTIPAWTGGFPQKGSIKKPEWGNVSYPKIVVQKPEFTITHADYKKYESHLAAGQIELFKRYPSFKMNVYKTIRSASYPKWYYKLSKWNATHCKLIGTDTPTDCRGGVFYPIPTNGAQVIWNHKTKWRGNNVRRYNEQAIVQPDGSYLFTKLLEDVHFFIPNSNHLDYTLNSHNRTFLYYLSHTLAPPRLAGTYILVHERSGAGNAGRVAWLYSPGLRRIRRAPDVEYDNPYQGTEGNEFYDQVDMFNGALAQYDWKLIGKKEMYIPYNNFKINSNNVSVADIIQPHHVNQNLIRYELHRVWVVEADLKPGQTDIFKKMVMYVDEDTWNIVEEDDYDTRGNLYKYQVGYEVFDPAVQVSTTSPEVIYDFFSGRYFVTAMDNGAKPDDLGIKYPPSFFTPAAVQESTTQ